ncbi:MAG: transporter substrate-binding domain-containing protein [Salinivirgaceae bacterium]|nr:transporter substrate-binding domain-containing protein [Salinivirgaceae bacterium]
MKRYNQKHKTRILSLILIFFVCHLSAWTQNENISKILKVGIYDNPPKIFVNSEGNPDGIFIDILESISKKENLQIEYITGSWTELYTKLANCEIDILPDMAYSVSRDSLFNFSMPVLSSWLQVFTTKKCLINRLDDLHNKRIGVLEASSQEEYMKVDIKKNYNNDYLIFTYDSYYNSVVALKEGKIDVIIANRFFYFSNLCNKEILPTGVVLQLSELHFAFSKNISPDLIKLFDKNISSLKNNPQSDFYISLQKWLNKTKIVIPGYLKWLLAILLFGLIVFLLFTFMLNYKVKAKTKILNKRNRELIAAKEKAEESDRLKTVFLQNMSHEIRTPMNGILGFLSLLKDSKIFDDTKNQYIEIINKSGERLLNTINDIIEISKIESNQIVVHQSNVDIAEIMDFQLKFFIEQAKQKGLILHISQQLPKIKSIIETDKNILNAILTNLLNNAIKYTNEGSIEFGYNLKTVSQTTVLEFFIKDTGIGIPKDRQGAIFERFIQADITDKMVRQGAGLGLSISKAFVELLGGKIWLSSEEGKGSIFYFTIPYKSQPHTKSDITTFVSDEGEKGIIRNIKVLIVEDDEISDLLILNLLKKISHEVLHAETGIEAIETCRNNPDLDLVLMDIKMPVMNGYEATRQIRQFNNDVVIIAQTAFGLSGDRDKAIAAGCNDYIAKPINKDKLLALVQKYLKK